MTPLLDEAMLGGADVVRKVRVTGVNIHLLAAPLSRRFGWSLNWTDSRTASLVEVTTNAGISGWGDGRWGGARLEENPELVVGRSPFEVEAIFDDLRPAAGHQTRVGEAAAGGLDTALWDLCGKLLGRPVCDLLGRRQRDRVHGYLTALYRQDWPDLSEGLAEEALEWKRRGWLSMKMKTGYGAETDARVTASNRRNSQYGPSDSRLYSAAARRYSPAGHRDGGVDRRAAALLSLLAESSEDDSAQLGHGRSDGGDAPLAGVRARAHGGDVRAEGDVRVRSDGEPVPGRSDPAEPSAGLAGWHVLDSGRTGAGSRHCAGCGRGVQGAAHRDPVITREAVYFAGSGRM